MTQFIPKPRYTAAWWSEVEIHNIGDGEPYSWEEGVLGDDSWIVWGNWSDDITSTYPGYPVFFPTPSDCLLWFRWQAVPFASNEGRDFSDLINRIDGAAIGTDAEALLRKMAPGLTTSWGDYGINKINSIHEHLSDLADVSVWRRVLKDMSIECRNGRWKMSKKTWGALLECFKPYQWDCVIDL